MSDNNSMDVDYDVPRTPARPTFRDTPQQSPMSPSSLSLSQAQVDTFKMKMTAVSDYHDWSGRIISAGDEKRKLHNVLISILLGLGMVLAETKKVFAPPMSQAPELVRSLNDSEVEEWKNAIHSKDWVGLITHSKLRKPAEDLSIDRQAAEIGNILHNHRRLGEAYTQDFIGDFATDFIGRLEQADIEAEGNEEKPLYAKAISVVQSSGVGKSRMLTEAGKQIFTLPICLRKPTDPGYPPGDKPVVKFFSALPKTNDLSLTAHTAIACFLAAAHQTMLELLQKARKEKSLNGLQLLEYWHELMEPNVSRDRREAFFTKVVEQAEAMKSKVETINNSPNRGKDGKPIPSDFDPFTVSRKIYELSAMDATKKLTELLSAVLPAKRISIMYFDEAHELGLHFWVFMRLVQHQLASTKMWYVFMGTKSSISYYAPHPSKLLSLRLKAELARLLPPYIDLGFDQQAMGRAVVSVCMGDMQTIEFLCRYGRPMWRAHLPEETQGEMIALASWKLRHGETFRATDKDHVFAVLSQRLCLDPVISASEAIELADRSVGHHMRLLTGFSTKNERFYTHSPSEPILVLGSIDILYNTSDVKRLQLVLNTLSQDLCSAGLIEKGILGELGARTLILIARDFAAPRHSSGRDLLKPVPLLHFLDTLFGSDIFTYSDKPKFDTAFGAVHVNFTHWISTRDSIPEKPNLQLLANLWARGAALQCCFSQESIDFLIPLYIGCIDPASKFDPSLLSVVVGQVKYKVTGDKKAEAALRPIGAPRDRHQPLPYLTLLMELGNESCYKETDSKIKCATSEPLADGKFGNLCDIWDAAVKNLETYRRQKKLQKDMLESLKKAVNDARLAVDSYNRYSISARGVSQDVYGILRKAGIAKEFATLLSIIMPSPVDEHSTRQHMRPLERLSTASSHTDWMSEYVVPNEPGPDT